MYWHVLSCNRCQYLHVAIADGGQGAAAAAVAEAVAGAVVQLQWPCPWPQLRPWQLLLQLLLLRPSGRWLHRLLSNKSLYFCWKGLDAKQQASSAAGQQDEWEAELRIGIGISLYKLFIVSQSACESGQTPWSYTRPLHARKYIMYK